MATLLAFAAPAWADGPGDAYNYAGDLTRAIADLAIRDYRAALRVDPDSAGARDGLARLGAAP